MAAISRFSGMHLMDGPVQNPTIQKLKEIDYSGSHWDTIEKIRNVMMEFFALNTFEWNTYGLNSFHQVEYQRRKISYSVDMEQCLFPLLAYLIYDDKNLEPQDINQALQNLLNRTRFRSKFDPPIVQGGPHPYHESRESTQVYREGGLGYISRFLSGKDNGYELRGPGICVNRGDARKNRHHQTDLVIDYPFVQAIKAFDSPAVLEGEIPLNKLQHASYQDVLAPQDREALTVLKVTDIGLQLQGMEWSHRMLILRKNLAVELHAIPLETIERFISDKELATKIYNALQKWKQIPIKPT